MLVDDGRLLHAGLLWLVENTGLGLHHGLLEGNLFHHRALVGPITGLLVLVLVLLVENAGLLQYGLVVNLLGRGLLFSSWLTHAKHPTHRMGWLWLLNNLLELLLLLCCLLLLLLLLLLELL